MKIQHDNQNLINSVDRLNKEGYKIIPVLYKRPLLPKWQKQNTQINSSYFSEYFPHATGIGILQGTFFSSGFIHVLDVDTEKENIIDDIKTFFSKKNKYVSFRFAKSNRFCVPFIYNSQLYYNKWKLNDGTCVELLGKGKFCVFEGFRDFETKYKWIKNKTHNFVLETPPKYEITQLNEEDYLELTKLLAKISITQKIVKNQFENIDFFTNNYKNIGLSQDEINFYLNNYKAENLDYDEWLEVGMAIHYETKGNGFSYWLNWSSKSPKHDSTYMEKKWESFNLFNEDERKNLTFKTIIKKANENIESNHYSINKIKSILNQNEKPIKKEENNTIKTHVKIEKIKNSPIILMKSEDLFKVEKINWIIENSFPPSSINMLFGNSGIGKSFLAIDLALSISSGKNWLGKRVDNGRFFYLANEGLYGLNQRMAAWYLYYGKPHLKSFWRNSKQLLLSNLTDYKTILKHITEVEEPIKMIFIDTLSQSIRGWNENSSEEMNILIDRLSTLAYYSKASVLCLHHTLKSDSSISRGSSVLLAGMDSAWGLLKDKDNEDTIILSCTKMRNGIVPEKVNLEIEQVKLPSQFDNSFGTTTSALIKEKRIRTEEEMREEEIKKELNI